MNDPDNKSQGKGFKGLQSLGSKTPEPAAGPPAIPERKVDVPDLPAAWSETAKQPVQPQPSQSQTATHPWRGWVIGLGFLGAIIGFFVWVGSLPSASNSYSDAAADAAAVATEAQAAADAAAAAGEPEFQPVLAHVTAVNANVREAASGSSAVLGSVSQMSQVLVVGREGSWSKIQADFDGQRMEGYISSKLLYEGTNEGARAIVCDVANSDRPYSGEVLLRNGSGSHHLTVNAGGQDALVKLRSNGVTELAFFVRAGESGTVETVADGHYQIMFATGEGFSRKCLEFVTSMNVISDPSTQAFEVTSDGYAEYYSTASYTLTRQTDGNFRPQTEDQGAFRE